MHNHNTSHILEVKNLCKHFPIKTPGKLEYLQALDDVSFSVRKGETLGVVGESGSGKSTLGRTILRLYSKTSGHAFFRGEDIFKKNYREMKAFRKKAQMIFQNPFASLNPRKRIDAILRQPFTIHGIKIRDNAIEELLNDVRIPTRHRKRYPHQFSGGQRQRINIARALALRPEFIICDEAVSALDVSVQAQIINLLLDLKEKHNLTYLFISHDLSVVGYISDTICVMYLGTVVEYAEKRKLFSHPKHPYTQVIIDSHLTPSPQHRKEREPLKGEIPSPLNKPKGCPFHTRCPKAMKQCSEIAPVLTQKEDGHWVSCHLYQ